MRIFNLCCNFSFRTSITDARVTREKLAVGKHRTQNHENNRNRKSFRAERQRRIEQSAGREFLMPHYQIPMVDRTTVGRMTDFNRSPPMDFIQPRRWEVIEPRHPGRAAQYIVNKRSWRFVYRPNEERRMCWEQGRSENQ